MESRKEFEKFLAEVMSTEVLTESPELSLVAQARERVFARKQVVEEKISFLDRLLLFFRLDFKVYHVGLCLLLISAGIFYVNEPNYTADNSSAFGHYSEALSITNTTISVNSSTMLTSIPTLVIRN